MVRFSHHRRARHYRHDRSHSRRRCRRWWRKRDWQHNAQHLPASGHVPRPVQVHAQFRRADVNLAAVIPNRFLRLKQGNHIQHLGCGRVCRARDVERQRWPDLCHVGRIGCDLCWKILQKACGGDDRVIHLSCPGIVELLLHGALRKGGFWIPLPLRVGGQNSGACGNALKACLRRWVDAVIDPLAPARHQLCFAGARTIYVHRTCDGGRSRSALNRCV